MQELNNKHICYFYLMPDIASSLYCLSLHSLNASECAFHWNLKRSFKQPLHSSLQNKSPTEEALLIPYQKYIYKKKCKNGSSHLINGWLFIQPKWLFYFISFVELLFWRVFLQVNGYSLTQTCSYTFKHTHTVKTISLGL